jgi:hypothetical protein
MVNRCGVLVPMKRWTNSTPSTVKVLAEVSTGMGGGMLGKGFFRRPTFDRLVITICDRC